MEAKLEYLVEEYNEKDAWECWALVESLDNAIDAYSLYNILKTSGKYRIRQSLTVVLESSKVD